MSKTQYRCKECGNDNQNLIVWEWTMHVPVSEVATMRVGYNGGVKDFAGEYTGYEHCEECSSDDIKEDV